MARINQAPKTRSQLVAYLTKLAADASGDRLRVYRSWNFTTKEYTWRGFEFAGGYASYRGRPILNVEHEVVAEMIANGLDTDSWLGARKLLGFLGVSFTKADARKARKAKAAEREATRERNSAKVAREHFAQLVARVEAISTVQDKSIDRLKEAWSIIEANLPVATEEN